MRLKIDEILAAVMPWELIVDLDGQSYPTHAPSVAEVGSLSAIGTMKREQQLLLIRSLFEGESPEVEKWDGAKMTAFISGYVEYFRQKKSEAIRQEAIRAIAKQIQDQANRGN